MEKIQNERIKKAYTLLVDVMEIDGDWKFLALNYEDAIAKVIDLLNEELK